MISREKCLEWAGLFTLAHPDSVIVDLKVSEIEALINRAYAEGQKDMRERAADVAWEYLREGQEAINLAIQELEIE